MLLWRSNKCDSKLRHTIPKGETKIVLPTPSLQSVRQLVLFHTFDWVQHYVTISAHDTYSDTIVVSVHIQKYSGKRQKYPCTTSLWLEFKHLI